MNEKDLLQEQLSEDVYFDLCKFIEELYLSEYDILILMARKFFNLFCIFHKLNCDKYERMGIPYKNEGKIITNRALPLFETDIKSGKYRKIVIADDIIIHGRTIREVYKDLLKLYPNIEVTFASYMRNEDEGIAYNEIGSLIKSRHIVRTEKWREMSDEIVKTFYISGRPYISYLPFFTLDISWEKLKEKIAPDQCLSLASSDMRLYGIDAFLYTGEELNRFNCLKSCDICSLRFYHYSLVDKVLAVPYYNMDVVEISILTIISDFVRNNYLEVKYSELVRNNDGAEEMRAMELEYVLSTWMAIDFFGQTGIPVKEWHRDIEMYNFYEKLLPDEMPDHQQILETAKRLQELGKSIEIVRPASNNGSLEQKYRELQDKYKKYYEKWMKLNNWLLQDMDKNTSFLQRFAENHLAINGDLDEKNWETGEEKSKRLYGVSLSKMIDDLAGFFHKLTYKDISHERCKQIVFETIIMSVDSGMGTIVKRVNKIAGKKYYESVLYAGEQNYKFYENTNLPVMYGLYLVEKKMPGQSKESISDKKQKFIQEAEKYMIENNYFYIEEEMQYLAKKHDLRKEYGVFLQHSIYKYSQNPVLEKMIHIALDICDKK